MSQPPQTTNLNVRELGVLYRSGQLNPIIQEGNVITSIHRVPEGRPTRSEDQYRTPERLEITYYKPASPSQVAPILTSKEEASWLPAYSAVKKTPSSEQTSWIVPTRTSFLNWEQPTKSGVPLAAIGTRPYSELKAKSWSESVGETWLGKGDIGTALTQVGSSLILRNIWDPKYREQMKAEGQKAFGSYTIPERLQLQRERMEQVNFAVSAALIGYTAYDFGRSAYNIIKYRSLIKEPVMIESGIPEETSEPMKVLRFSGKEADRFASSSDITPTEQPVADTFKISPTRGTWSNKPIIAKDTRASTTLSQLFLARPISEVSFDFSVPFNAYPAMTTELALSGMAFGNFRYSSQLPSLPKSKSIIELPKATAPIHERISITKPEPLTTTTIVLPFSRTRTSNELLPTQIIKPIGLQNQAQIQVPVIKSIPTRAARFRDILDIDTIVSQVPTVVQQQAQAPIAKQAQAQSQASIQRQIQRTIQLEQIPPRYPSDDFFRKTKRRKPTSIFNTSGRSRRYYPILTSKQFKKLMA